jgi:hypothetical protein
MKRPFALLVLACFWLLCSFPASAEQDKEKGAEKSPLRAAIFVQNRAGTELMDQIDVLNDHISSGLTGKGFSIIDKNVVIAKFRESRETDDAVRKGLKTLEEVIRLGKSEASVEDAVTGASALRIAQMIGADYLVMATINSLGVETRTFKGEDSVYGTNNRATIFNLRIGLKVLEGNQGGTVYGDMVTASDRLVVGQNLTICTTDIIPRLIEAGARKITDNIAGKVEEIRNIKVKTQPTVEFTVNSNVEGSTVELDGAVIGSAPGRFTAAPGLHQLRISKEWLSTWERTVNIFPNQILNVSLELSEEGLRRYSTLEQLKADIGRSKQQTEMEMKEREAAIGIAKEKSESEAYSNKKIAEGEKKKREESYERVEGQPIIHR